MLLGDDAPVAIKNERNMIAHGFSPNSKDKNHVQENTADYVTAPVKSVVKLIIHDDGTIVADGQEMSIEDISDYLKSITNDNQK